MARPDVINPARFAAWAAQPRHANAIRDLIDAHLLLQAEHTALAAQAEGLRGRLARQGQSLPRRPEAHADHLELWRRVAAHLPDDLDPQDRDRIRARFLAGAAEHGDAWLDWPLERFDREAQDERDDAVTYPAMQQVAADHQARRGAR